jgi:hypothetical protein
MKYTVLMYADPAATMAMSAADREPVRRKHKALGAEVTKSGEPLSAVALDYPAR